jgi:saccharopepsin
LSYGAEGILGLGFTSLSTIDALVNKTKSSDGRSLLFNAFEDNPSEPNFISFLMTRSANATDGVEGSFSVGEYEDDYKAIANSPKIPTWPANSPKRWNVLMDAILFPGKDPLELNTNVTGAPSNRAVALLDSGTSYTYVSDEIANAIYGGVPGAKYNAAQGQWSIPCDAEIDMALQFAFVPYFFLHYICAHRPDSNIAFPINPLDVAPKSLSDANTCFGSFIPQSVSVGAGEL